MFDSEQTDAFASADLGNQSLKDRIVTFAKIGFWIATALLALQIFMKAVYFANL